jgi:hypothetical protein
MRAREPKEPVEPKKTGRPTDYTPELADKLLEKIASGDSLRSICETDEFPSKVTVLKWLAKDADFRAKYSAAKELGAEAIAEEIFDISDDGRNDWMEKLNFNGGVKGWEQNGESVNRSKLRVDSRKWYLSKIMPKKYGEKQAVALEASIKTESTEAAQLAAVLTQDELELIRKRIQESK